MESPQCCSVNAALLIIPCFIIVRELSWYVQSEIFVINVYLRRVSSLLLLLLCVYLILNQHGDIDKHVMELFDAVFQPHDVFVTSFDLMQGLLVDLRVHDLRREGGRECVVKRRTENKERQQKFSREQVVTVAMSEKGCSFNCILGTINIKCIMYTLDYPMQYNHKLPQSEINLL